MNFPPNDNLHSLNSGSFIPSASSLTQNKNKEEEEQDQRQKLSHLNQMQTLHYQQVKLEETPVFEEMRSAKNTNTLRNIPSAADTALGNISSSSGNGTGKENEPSTINLESIDCNFGVDAANSKSNNILGLKKESDKTKLVEIPKTTPNQIIPADLSQVTPFTGLGANEMEVQVTTPSAIPQTQSIPNPVIANTSTTTPNINLFGLPVNPGATADGTWNGIIPNALNTELTTGIGAIPRANENMNLTGQLNLDNPLANAIFGVANLFVELVLFYCFFFCLYHLFKLYPGN